MQWLCRFEPIMENQTRGQFDKHMSWWPSAKIGDFSRGLGEEMLCGDVLRSLCAREQNIYESNP